MPYSTEETTNLLERMHAIRNAQLDASRPANYADAPGLREIAEIVRLHHQQEPTPDAETLTDTIGILTFLANCYDEMERYSLAGAYFTQLVATELAVLADASTETDIAFLETLQEDFGQAVVARNRYQPDDCTDLLEQLAKYFPIRTLSALYESAQERASMLPQHDPVEGTEAYLAVIDEVEETLAAQDLSPDDAAYMAEKARLLAASGIAWAAPQVSNPNAVLYE